MGWTWAGWRSKLPGKTQAAGVHSCSFPVGFSTEENSESLACCVYVHNMRAGRYCTLLCYAVLLCCVVLHVPLRMVDTRQRQCAYPTSAFISNGGLFWGKIRYRVLLGVCWLSLGVA